MKVYFLLSLFLLQLGAFAQDKQSHVAGEVMIRLHHEVDAQEFTNGLSRTYPDQSFELKEVLVPSSNIILLGFSKDWDEAAILPFFKAKSEVQFVQWNHTNIAPRKSPNDPLKVGQWYLDNIRAEEAWDVVYEGDSTANGREIVIAIVDVSFEITHGDLKKQFWKNKHEIPLNNIDDDKNGYIDDYDGWNVYTDTGHISSTGPSGIIDAHGTKVAGIIGAQSHNSHDIAGINWNTKMLPIQGSSTTESIVVKSYSYLLEMRKRYNRTNGDSGAYIVAQNSSFGVDNARAQDYPIWCSLYDDLGKVGIVSIAAGPNSLVNVDVVGDVPCNCGSDYLVTVSRTDENDEISSAGYGVVSMDMGAPGKRVLSTTPPNTTSPGNGSSFAAPMATAAIGLMYEAYPLEMYNKSLDSIAYYTAIYLKESVDQFTGLADKFSTGGRLNLYKAVLKARDTPALNVGELVNSKAPFIYPNPAVASVTIGGNDLERLKVYSLKGQKMLDIALGESGQTIDVAEFPKGMYIFELQSKNGIFSRNKIFLLNEK